MVPSRASNGSHGPSSLEDLFGDNRAGSHLVLSRHRWLRVVRVRSLERLASGVRERALLHGTALSKAVGLEDNKKWTRRDFIREHQWHIGCGGLGIPTDIQAPWIGTEIPRINCPVFFL